jgi:lipopolysaccharide transport system ATP-binding protein
MSDTAIRVESLSKKYILGHQKQEKYTTLRDSIANSSKNFLKGFRGKKSADRLEENEEFWALKDVTFEIKQGDRVGIIGRNGAGKSTLLKILSRITEPTEGSIRIKGRVASLLEVGTGFHPELTGRENIYLNGSILGMSKIEIQERFDRIVTFAEVEKFLDTPVKHFSSGMYVRLAFAVAAHLESEVLIVDEVLAVGDAQFQKKCLSRMDEISKKEGKTIIFVSHQMSIISKLCPSTILLKTGRIVGNGSTDLIVPKYFDLITNEDVYGSQEKKMDMCRPDWAMPLINKARVLDKNDRECSHFPLGSELTIEMCFDTKEFSPVSNPVMGIVVNKIGHGPVGGVNTRMTGLPIESGEYSNGVIKCKLKNVSLLQGQYTIDLWLGDGQIDLDVINEYLTFKIEESNIYGTGHPPFGNLGIIYFNPTWQLQLN